jgi:hypothetical protein
MSYSQNDNKIVTISKGTTDWKSAYSTNPYKIPSNLVLYMENDISFQLHQDYEDPISEIAEAVRRTKLGKIVNGIMGVTDAAALITNVRAMTKYTGAKAWKSSSQITFDLQFSFFMGMTGEYSGLKEVYLPISALGKIFLPSVQDGLLRGPGPSYSDLLSTQAKNVLLGLKASIDTIFSLQIPSLADVKEAGVKAGVLNAVAENALKLDDKNNISIKIGNIYNFTSILPMNFTYSFSRETDSEGYPISGSCSINCETMLIGTSKILPSK